MIIQIIVTVLAIVLGTISLKVFDINQRLGQYLAWYSASGLYNQQKRQWPWVPQPVDSAGVLTRARGSVKQYQYTPIRGLRQIRLLRVSFGDNPEQCICELFPVSLDDMPMEYLAFSYTWGDPAAVSRLTFGNNEMLSVTKSVRIILDTLFSKCGSIYVWIDSICINQEDNDEKAVQVRLMSEIYAKACQVLISLGEATPESDLGMDVIAPLRHAIRGAYRACNGSELVCAEMILRRMRRERSSPSFCAFQKLLNRRWFNRIWVVQEIAMASLNPLFICGDRAMTWETLIFVATMINELSLMELLLDRNTILATATQAISSLRKMNQVRIKKQELEEIFLQDILLELHGFCATNARDKIFALLGLATDADDAMLDPDYEASVEEVYTRIALYLLQRDSSISILHISGIGNPREYSNLPSWVPQWHASREEGYVIYGSQPYKAAGGTTPNVSFSDGVALTVDGIMVDTVKYISSKPDFLNANENTNMSAQLALQLKVLLWMEEVDNLVAILRSKYLSTLYPGKNQDWTEATWRTLIANSIFGELAPAEYGESYNIWRQMLTPMAAMNSRVSFDAESKQKATLAMHAVFYNMRNKRFFTSDKGYIGTTSPGTLSGDKVCIFLGSHTPFIVREIASGIAGEGRQFHLVGEAYVHSLMDGEGLGMGKVEGIKLV